MEKLLTREDVMTILRISKPTLHKLMKEKKLRYVKVNRRVLFREEDLKKFINNHVIEAK